MSETYIERPKILLVEDDTNLGFVIKDNLEHNGFEVYLCENGEQGLQMFREESIDLCLLDVMLPVKDGFTLASQIRELDAGIPILFLTARSMKEDRINGFNLGADDYITKPFSIEELVLRIKVFLKRSGKENHAIPPVFKISEYHFDYKNLDLIHKKGAKHLTQKEADLLKLLCDHSEQMIKREEILRQIWDTDDYFAGRSMDVFISKLRKYLVHDPSIEIINYHGKGFKLTVSK